MKLNGNATLPPIEAPEKSVRPAPAPAPATASRAAVERGAALFERRCYYCHGSRAISGGEVPDLRHSAIIGDGPAFHAVVIQGALAVNGMPAFGRDLNARDAEAIRSYILERAAAE